MLTPVKMNVRYFSNMTFVWHYNHEHLYNFDVLKAWDYAQTFFRSEELRLAYIKAEIGTRKHSFWWFEDDCMVMHTCMHAVYVAWLCVMPMYHGYVSRLCITAMYHGYVSWLCLLYIYIYLLCIISNDSSESKKVIFLKNALNIILIADSESTQKSVQIRTGIIDS